MMIYKLARKILIALIVFNIGSNLMAQTIKVACIGDSVTFGAGIENREENSYPVQLQNLWEILMKW